MFNCEINSTACFDKKLQENTRTGVIVMDKIDAKALNCVVEFSLVGKRAICVRAE